MRSELGVQNFILDAYWVRQFLDESKSWQNMLTTVQDCDPYFHINPVSFSKAWVASYALSDEDHKRWLRQEVWSPLAGVAELENRGVQLDEEIVSVRSGRIILSPAGTQFLFEVACVAHETPAIAQKGHSQIEPEQIWVLAAYNFVSAEGDPTFLLVEEIDPYLEIIEDLRYHHLED